MRGAQPVQLMRVTAPLTGAVAAPAGTARQPYQHAVNICTLLCNVQGIVYVVDCCYVKQRAYNPLVGLESLLVAPTSKV